MPNTPKNIKIIIRTDYETVFNSLNPTLRPLELVCSIQDDGSCKWKLGDGNTAYNDLPYVKTIQGIQTFVCYPTGTNIEHVMVKLSKDNIKTEDRE